MTGAGLHPAELDDQQLLAQCDVRRQRRSGPGGQHRNKVETAVVITHRPTGIQGAASERRSQAENRHQALLRLRVNLAIDVRTPRPEGPPSQLWQSRLVGGRIAVAATHADFPALLAEALDVLARCEMDLPRAARQLGCTPSQLVKFLKRQRRALELVNHHRQQQGLQRLQ